jgi:hypothetical protein
MREYTVDGIQNKYNMEIKTTLPPLLGNIHILPLFARHVQQ